MKIFNAKSAKKTNNLFAYSAINFATFAFKKLINLR